MTITYAAQVRPVYYVGRSHCAMSHIHMQLQSRMFYPGNNYTGYISLSFLIRYSLLYVYKDMAPHANVMTIILYMYYYFSYTTSKCCISQLCQYMQIILYHNICKSGQFKQSAAHPISVRVRVGDRGWGMGGYEEPHVHTCTLYMYMICSKSGQLN